MHQPGLPAEPDASAEHRGAVPFPLECQEKRAPARKPQQPKAPGIFITLATCLSEENRFLLPRCKAALMSDGQPPSQQR